MTRRKRGHVAAYDHENGDPVVNGEVWLRGHLPDNEARVNVSAVLADYELTGTPGAVRYTFARTLPCDGFDFSSEVTIDWPPKRGAYPVTVVEVLP
jgi:hypothetical protein